MKTQIKIIAIGLTFVSLAFLPVACKEGTRDLPSDESSDTTVNETTTDWELEELTITELRAVPLSESFRHAREAFALGDTATAIEQIKIVGNFFSREAETRSGESQEAFEEYSQELSKLASLMETEGNVTEEDLDEIFANAHLILALDRAGSAKAAANEDRSDKAGENMKAAVDHAKLALRQVGKIATAEMSKAGEAIENSANSIDAGAEHAKEKAISAADKTWDYMVSITQSVKEKIKGGRESTTRKTKEVTGDVIERTGQVVEKMGEKMKNTGNKIKPDKGSDTTDSER